MKPAILALAFESVRSMSEAHKKFNERISRLLASLVFKKREFFKTESLLAIGLFFIFTLRALANVLDLSQAKSFTVSHRAFL